MEIKENLYIRYYDAEGIAKIGKILKKEDYEVCGEEVWLTDNKQLIDGEYIGETVIADSEHIIKISDSLKDLVELRDYINGYEVDEMTLNCKNASKVLSIFYREPYRKRVTVHEITEDNDINSIVTREQFESMWYKRGE